MRALHSIAAAMLSGVMGFGGRVAAPVVRDRAPEPAEPVQRGRHPKPIDKDPYSGIKTRGRCWAEGAMLTQQDAFAKTRIGKRNARGRRTSNPFTGAARRIAYDRALRVGHGRADAMKIARRAS